MITLSVVKLSSFHCFETDIINVIDRERQTIIMKIVIERQRERDERERDRRTLIVNVIERKREIEERPTDRDR
jgi:hypothetical protein